jgi:hypothetical protein
MQKYFSSSFKNKLFNERLCIQYNKLGNFNKNSLFFFSNSKENNESEINIHVNEETIEVEPINNQQENSSIKITDLYSIKSKKLGDPNIKKFIDSSKFTNNNAKLRVYSKEDFNKDPFKNSNLIPVSPKLGPFEVINNNLKDNYLDQ